MSQVRTVVIAVTLLTFYGTAGDEPRNGQREVGRWGFLNAEGRGPAVL